MSLFDLSDADKSAGDLSNLSISKKTSKRLSSSGIDFLAPIQLSAFKQIDEDKRRICICGESGSGRTMGALVPVVDRATSLAKEDPAALVALVVVGSKDDLVPMTDRIAAISPKLNLVIVAKQNEEKNEDFNGLAVGIPSAISANIDSLPKSVKFVVFDDVDLMLESGHADQVKKILDHFDCQVVFTCLAESEQITKVMNASTEPDSVQFYAKASSSSAEEDDNQPIVTKESPFIKLIEEVTEEKYKELLKAADEVMAKFTLSNELIARILALIGNQSAPLANRPEKRNRPRVDNGLARPGFTLYHIISKNRPFTGFGNVCRLLRYASSKADILKDESGNEIDVESFVGDVKFIPDGSEAFVQLSDDFGLKFQEIWHDTNNVQMFLAETRPNNLVSSNELPRDNFGSRGRDRGGRFGGRGFQGRGGPRGRGSDRGKRNFNRASFAGAGNGTPNKVKKFESSGDEE